MLKGVLQIEMKNADKNEGIWNIKLSGKDIYIYISSIRESCNTVLVIHERLLIVV